METYTIWVCLCCMLCEANGECCTDYAPMHDDNTPCFEGVHCYRSHTTPQDGSAPLLHGGDGCEPLSLIMPEDGVSLGMVAERHAEGCEARKHEDYHVDGFDCDCEVAQFSRSSCEGCGSLLHGERHALTVFVGERLQVK